jgi:hypothetical protein
VPLFLAPEDDVLHGVIATYEGKLHAGLAHEFIECAKLMFHVAEFVKGNVGSGNDFVFQLP